MERSEEINEIAKAISKMQAEMEPALKDSKGYNYRYADFSAVWNVLRKPLTDNGLMVTQDTFTLQEGASVQTFVVHSSGQWIKSGILTIPAAKKDAHTTGSCLTYAKRYQLCALLGIIADEDDDGLKAQQAGPRADSRVVDPNAWIEKHAKKYEKKDILDYLEARSNHTGKDVRHNVQELAKNEAGFHREINAWIAKHRTPPSEDIPDDAKQE